NTCSSTLSSPNSCLIQVSFSPSATGVRNGVLNATYTGVSGSPALATLLGTGVSGSGTSFFPASLNFGNQIISTPTGGQLMYLTNNCSSTLNISAITIAGTNGADFVKVLGNCPAALNVGATCMQGVVFPPSGTGLRQANLVFTDDAVGSP